MKRTFVIAGVLFALGAGPVLLPTSPAFAGNSAVEASLQNYGDVSMFYQALLNTGVINELSEGEHYTIFAPTNAAFAEIRRQNYPCFYSEQCRPQIAAMMRNHIVVGSYSLNDLKTYGQGLPTLGTKPVVVTESYVNHYTVNGQDILSDGDTGSNKIYRIDGVMTDPQELAQFQTVNIVPASVPAESVTTTVTQHTYPVPPMMAYPAGGMDTYPDSPNDNMTETTTITKRYTTESQ